MQNTVSYPVIQSSTTTCQTSILDWTHSILYCTHPRLLHQQRKERLYSFDMLSRTGNRIRHNNVFTRRTTTTPPPGQSWFHASSVQQQAPQKNPKKSTTSRDTRIAGRLRFYKDVGVISAEAPWRTTTTASEASVASPISAGVDDTASASGVHHPSTSTSSSSLDQLKQLLSPRSPGSSTTPITQTTADWFGVTLDGRILKTPMGKTLAVPSEKLAYGIAAEWNSQQEHLKPTDMPLMTLACTTLDQVAHHPHVYRDQSIRFLPTDTTCFWADPTEDRILHRRQEQAWKDLHQFVQREFDHAPAFALGAQEAMLMSRKRGDAKPYVGLPHPPDLLSKANDWAESLDAWHLAAFASMSSQAKSFLVAWAMMTPDSPLEDLNKAVEASRVEEEFQIANWGLVEGGHDYDRLNCSIQLHSAQLFVKAIALDNNL